MTTEQKEKIINDIRIHVLSIVPKSHPKSSVFCLGDLRTEEDAKWLKVVFSTLARFGTVGIDEFNEAGIPPLSYISIRFTPYRK